MDFSYTLMKSQKQTYRTTGKEILGAIGEGGGFKKGCCPKSFLYVLPVGLISAHFLVPWPDSLPKAHQTGLC